MPCIVTMDLVVDNMHLKVNGGGGGRGNKSSAPFIEIISDKRDFFFFSNS